LAWKVEFEASARKDIEKLDKQVAKRIVAFLAKRAASIRDPRSVGQALKGSDLGNFWKYRVGDYRIICDIQDKRVLILVLRVGHRREVYNR
jgi:mRNA interferase RelE/StbE